MADTVQGVSFEDHPNADQVLTREAQGFLAKLHRTFNARRLELLAAREERQKKIDAGGTLSFPPETESVRNGDWKVAPIPDDLQDRRVEITGPCDRKMMINALNSGAKVFMADCEDAQSPSWANQVTGQVNLMDAARKSIRLVDEARGKTYELADTIATLLVRPRGWHLPERHFKVDGEPMSGSLFDFGLSFFHNVAGGPERRAVVHLQLHQDLPSPRRGDLPRPLAGHDDSPLHVQVHRASREELPQARRARDRRNGRLHPESA